MKKITFVVLFLGLLSCTKEKVLAYDQNGYIYLSEVQNYANFLEIFYELSKEDKLRLARRLSLMRELAKRAQKENLHQSQDFLFYQEHILEEKTSYHTLLTDYVKNELKKGVLFLESRSFIILGKNEDLILKEALSYYEKLERKEISFTELLQKENQETNFQNLPLALFPAKVRLKLKECEAGKILRPFVVEKTAFITECKSFSYVAIKNLEDWLFLKNLEEKNLLVQAEVERLKQEFFEKYSCPQNLDYDWQKKEVLFQSGSFVFTKKDFLDFLYKNSLRAQNHKALAEFFQRACHEKRAVLENSFRIEPLLKNFFIQEFLATLYEKKVLVLMGNNFQEGEQDKGSKNSILEEIGFRFMIEN